MSIVLKKNNLSKYYDVRPEMDTFDLLQWSSDSFFGEIVKSVTGSDIIHSGVVVYLTSKTCPEVKERWTMEALGSGFFPRSLRKRLKHYDGQVVWYPLKEKYWEKRHDLWQATWKYVATPYDFLGLTLNAFDYISPDDDTLICSEAVYFSGLTGGLETEWPEEKAPRPADMPKLGWWDISRKRKLLYKK